MMHMQTTSKLPVLKYKCHAVIRVQCVYASKANKMEILQTQIFLTELSVETATTPLKMQNSLGILVPHFSLCILVKKNI